MNNPADLSTIPQFEEGTVPQADVDERTFEFVFTNIEPGEYAVVVLSRNGPQVPARFLEDESLAIITIENSDDPKEIDIGNLNGSLNLLSDVFCVGVLPIGVISIFLFISNSLRPD